MAWTVWRRIADRKYYYTDCLDWDGPCCYELALGGPRGGVKHIVYTGETKNEKIRMIAYAQHGSHLAKTIRAHLRMGWTLYYRAISRGTKTRAKTTQDHLLYSFPYGWNVNGNRLSKYRN